MEDKRKKETSKERALHRIKIIQGHLKAIEKMIEEDKYCLDIVNQSLAVQKALKKVDSIIIKEHMQTCMIHQILSGEKERTTEELLKLFDYK